MYASQMIDAPPAFADPHWQQAWLDLDCRLNGVQAVFEQCVDRVLAQLTPRQQQGLWRAGRQLGRLGRGAAPVLAWLTHWPAVVTRVGAEVLDDVLALVHAMHKSPNSGAIAPLIASLDSAAQRLGSTDGVRQYLALVHRFMEQTTGSIHGRQQTVASPGLVPLLEQVPSLLQRVSIAGMQRWVDHGARVHAHHPQQQADYFALLSPDSVAMLQRQRQGTLLVDVQRTLGMSLQAMWRLDLPLLALTGGSADARRSPPVVLDAALGLPDVLEPLAGVTALARYRLMLMHAAAHKAWSEPLVADNWTPVQRLVVEGFEDARIDRLLLQRWPGVRPTLLALLPPVHAQATEDGRPADLHHLLAVWNRAVLDPSFTSVEDGIRSFVGEFEQALLAGAGTRAMGAMALRFAAQLWPRTGAWRTDGSAAQQPDWRDDNRHLWRFVDADEDDGAGPRSQRQAAADTQGLPPRYYPEWDCHVQAERPDWVAVYESLHPSGAAADVDRLLAQHAHVTRRIERVLERLKPQGRERVRHLSHGSELDLELAQQAWIDWRLGHAPDERVQQHWRPHERDVSVQLVMDLSASLQERIPASGQTVLQVSQAAVALLGWTLQQLGDPLAIGGFHSNGRQAVRYMHLKGFDEPWGPPVKARLAAIEPAYSTRLGTALRHAGRTLVQRRSARKLLLLLTDGEPFDVDVSDPDYLTQDARQVVHALQAQGVFVWCIQLHPAHEDSVQRVFGGHYTLIDRLPQLPQILASVFFRLTQ